MNIFDKTLLFEMSYALMRRFAFVEVPAPSTAIYEEIWQREIGELAEAEKAQIATILSALEGLRSIKQLGPAIFKDMARFAAKYLMSGTIDSAGTLTFQLFYSFLLPQFEGIDERSGRRLFRELAPLVGRRHRQRLLTVLHEVLGVNPPADEVDAFDEDE